MRAGTLKPEEHFIRDDPYYACVDNEVEIFDAAYRNQLPILLKGPTVCGMWNVPLHEVLAHYTNAHCAPHALRGKKCIAHGPDSYGCGYAVGG